LENNGYTKVLPAPKSVLSELPEVAVESAEVLLSEEPLLQPDVIIPKIAAAETTKRKF
jgi:hypothetical protein